MAEPSSVFREMVETASGAARASDPASLPDEELLRRYRDGRGAEAFAEMVRRHQPMVFRTCSRLLGNVHDAEDATQSAFLVLAQRPEVVRRSLAGCLHELARAAVAELCRSRRRRSQREEMAVRLGSLFRRLCGGAQLMEHQELREELDVALAELPDSLRQAVLLHYLEGHSQQEAAQRAGCTTAALGWRAMKGIQRLRDVLGRRGVVVAPATLAALLTAEGQAAAALAPGIVGASVATATATQVAASLTRRFLLGAALRRVSLIGVLSIAALGLGAGALLLPRAPRETPSPPVPARFGRAPVQAASALGVFEHSEDIGGPKYAGRARHEGGAYTLKGGGAHIYGKEDQFRFVYRPWTGDGEIVARVATDPGQDARQVMVGVMFRERLTPDSHHVAILLAANGDCHAKFRDRANPASACDIQPRNAPGKHWVRLVRRGNTCTSYVRTDGTQTWKIVKELETTLKSSLYVGLAVTAHDDAHLATATFDRVTLGTPSSR